MNVTSITNNISYLNKHAFFLPADLAPLKFWMYFRGKQIQNYNHWPENWLLILQQLDDLLHLIIDFQSMVIYPFIFLGQIYNKAWRWIIYQQKKGLTT
jgi:hypothetical protein